MDLLKLLPNDDINDDSDSESDDNNCNNNTTTATCTEVCCSSTSSSFSTTKQRNDDDKLNDANKQKQKHDEYTFKYDNNSTSSTGSGIKKVKYNPQNPTITVTGSIINKKRHITTTNTSTAPTNCNHATDDDTIGTSTTTNSAITILPQQQQQQQDEKQNNAIIYCDTCLSNCSTTTKTTDTYVKRDIRDSSNNNNSNPNNNNNNISKRNKFVRSKHHTVGNWSGYIYTPIHFVIDNKNIKNDNNTVPSSSATSSSSSSKCLSSDNISFWNIATIAVQSYYNVLQQRQEEEQQQLLRSKAECHMKSILFHQHFPCSKCLRLLQRSGSTTASTTTISSNTNSKVKKKNNTTTMEFHMSLSRTYYLQEANIQSFVHTLRNRLQYIPSFSIRFLSKNISSTTMAINTSNNIISPGTSNNTSSTIQNESSSSTTISSSTSSSIIKRISNMIDILLNDNCTRCFLVWCINDTQSIVQLTKLVQQYINPLLVSYQQISYYNNPNFHISLASHKVETLVGCGGDTNKNDDEIQQCYNDNIKEKYRITLRDKIRYEFYHQLLLSQQGTISDDKHSSHHRSNCKKDTGNSYNGYDCCSTSSSSSDDDNADSDSSTNNSSDSDDSTSLKTEENVNNCGKGNERTKHFSVTNKDDDNFLNEICSKQHKINTISCTFGGTIRQHHFQLM